MKLWHKLMIGGGATLFVWGGVIAIVLIAKITWFLFVGVGIFSAFVWVVIGTILIYKLWTKKKPEVLKLDLENAEILAKYMMAHDEDNPDNFMIKKRILRRVGEPGSERTPVRVLIGKGSEKKEIRVVIINLEDPHETTMLIDPSEHEIEKMTIAISKRQPEMETSEFIPGGVDPYTGRPLPSRIITKKVSQSVVKAEEEKEEAEKGGAF